jgi:hypothetical protein
MKDLAQAADKPMVDTRSREDRIREVAYRRYLARGESEGDESIDWLAAEAEIDAEDAGRQLATRQPKPPRHGSHKEPRGSNPWLKKNPFMSMWLSGRTRWQTRSDSRPRRGESVR